MIAIIGAGGHGRVLAEVLRRNGEAITAWVDAASSFWGTAIDGVIIEPEETAKVLARPPETVRLVNGIGNRPGSGSSGLGVRRDVYRRYADRGFGFVTVVSCDAVAATSATLAEGCQILTGAIVHPGAIVGVNAIVNTGAQIDHDCRIGAHAHVAPGAVLCGWVSVGEGAHVGAGAVVVDRVTIGDRAVVGAGAVVLHDVAAGDVVVGNPARKIARPV